MIDDPHQFQIKECLFGISVLHLSFNELLLDLLSSQGGRHPFKGVGMKRDGVDRFLCRIEIEDRRQKALLSLFFSLSYIGWSGSCRTAETWSCSGSMQLQTDPAENKN